ncbi:glycosyltransferase family 4 protein [Candidatus Berkelbacteria bacterium]|nr:glycosyltransferase family 4 protein [Candidatus Berkelbacteria bacterium]
MAGTDRVTIVSTGFPPNVMGGAEQNAKLLADYLAECGWDVEVITGAAVLPRNLPYAIHSVPALRPRPSIVYEPWWAWRTAQRLRPLIAPDRIVHAFDVLSRGAVAALGYPRTVATIQDVSPICGSITGLLSDGTICTGDTLQNLAHHAHGTDEHHGLTQWVRLIRYYTATVIPYRRQLLNQYTALTTVSQFLRDFLSLPRATVVPDLLVPLVATEALPRQPGPALITVGRLGVDKGTDLLLDALPLLPRFTATFVGRGNTETWQQRAAQLGVADRVRFVGPVPLADVAKWYLAADVAVQAGRWPEPSSRMILEAMSLGRAVVGPNYAGPAELITEGCTGRLFERGNAASLARTIEQAYQEREALGERAREAAAAYLPSRVGPRYLELYAALPSSVSTPVMAA